MSDILYDPSERRVSEKDGLNLLRSSLQAFFRKLMH